MLSSASTHARRLAVVLEVLALLALVSGAFPLALSSPIWWLRLGDSEAGVFGQAHGLAASRLEPSRGVSVRRLKGVSAARA